MGLLLVLLVILTVALVLSADFFITAGIFYLICWGFGLTFTWKLAVGVWAVKTILESIFTIRIKND